MNSLKTLRFFNSFYSLKSTKLIVLGNQKSGTTAIASLIAQATDLSSMLDSPLLWEPNYSKIVTNQINLSQLINSNKYYFSKNIIKEPNLTFLFDRLKGIYPAEVKYLFIIRDPRDNIRSILNRIKVSGNLDNISAYKNKFSAHENVIFDKKIMSYQYDNYIEQLAERWVSSAKIYFANQTIFHLVKYEDFNSNKIEFIYKLCETLNFKIKNDISSKVEIKYQPMGNNSSSWEEFFGSKNLTKINEICKYYISKVDYRIDGPISKPKNTSRN